MATQPELRPEVLLVIDDDEAFVTPTTEVLRLAGYETLAAISLQQAAAQLEQHFVDLILFEERLKRDSGLEFFARVHTEHPELTGLMITVDSSFSVAQRAMRIGVAEILEKPLRDEYLLQAIRRLLQDTGLAREARRNRWNAQHSARPSGIIGESQALRDVLGTVSLVAASNSTVLIQGESGTGKELIARAIHEASPRCRKAMVSVNLAAIAPGLIESELFGAAKGSYTDSKHDRNGYFEEANGSTLFLDEIGDAPLYLQVRLLRALEERTITRVGETRPRPVDFRLVAATNRNLSKDIQAGNFRSDLFFRLNVVPIVIPPLRQRVDDIEPLARYFLSRFSSENGDRARGFEARALSKMRQYSWPGNVREMRSVIEFAVLVAKGPLVTVANLRMDAGAQLVDHWRDLLDKPLNEATTAFQLRYFERLLQRAEGSKARAAELAGMDRSTIYMYLKKLGVE